MQRSRQDPKSTRSGLSRAKRRFKSTRKNDPPSVRKSRRIWTVFLSYHFAEEDYSVGLIRLLRDRGFGVVTGADCLESVSGEVLRRIMKCDLFVGLLTRYQLKADGTFTTGAWLLQETGVAIAAQKPLVLMVEDGVTDIGGLQGDLQRVHFAAKRFLIAALDVCGMLKGMAQRDDGSV